MGYFIFSTGLSFCINYFKLSSIRRIVNGWLPLFQCVRFAQVKLDL